jgi:hypothetical protein
VMGKRMRQRVRASGGGRRARRLRGDNREDSNVSQQQFIYLLVENGWIINLHVMIYCICTIVASYLAHYSV